MFLYSRWMELPLSTRNAIASAFKIVKKGATEVFNNEIKSDGYVITEIEEALNIDALQKYVGSAETDMAILWEMLVAKAEGRDYKPPVPPEAAPIATKTSSKCDYCDTRGWRHKRDCTRPIPVM